jgi:hypothetical protein
LPHAKANRSSNAWRKDVKMPQRHQDAKDTVKSNEKAVLKNPGRP